MTAGCLSMKLQYPFTVCWIILVFGSSLHRRLLSKCRCHHAFQRGNIDSNIHSCTELMQMPISANLVGALFSPGFVAGANRTDSAAWGWCRVEWSWWRQRREVRLVWRPRWPRAVKLVLKNEFSHRWSHWALWNKGITLISNIMIMKSLIMSAEAIESQ